MDHSTPALKVPWKVVRLVERKVKKWAEQTDPLKAKRLIVRRESKDEIEK